MHRFGKTQNCRSLPLIVVCLPGFYKFNVDEPARGMPSPAGISGVHCNFVGEVMIGVKDSNKVALAVLEAKQ